MEGAMALAHLSRVSSWGYKRRAKDRRGEQTRVIEGGKEDEAGVSGDGGDRGHVWRRGDEGEPWSRGSGGDDREHHARASRGWVRAGAPWRASWGQGGRRGGHREDRCGSRLGHANHGRAEAR